MTLLRSSATVSALTGISRATGFARDLLMAAALGTSALADAFFVAFQLPGLFRRLLSVGSFSSVFVPMLAGRLATDGRSAASAFAGEVLAGAVMASVVLTSALQLAMPWVMYLIAPGFASDPARFNLAVEFARIMLIYFLFVMMILHLGGVLNVLGRFAAAAAMPILLNLLLMLSLFTLSPLLETPAHGFAWGLAAAGAVQFACLLVACRRTGFPLRFPRPRLTPGVRRLLKLTTPAVVGSGAMHINLLVDAAIASLLASGSISYLYYAGRVMQLPAGIFGLAVGTALLPLLSRQLRVGDGKGEAGSMNRALEMVLFLTLPSAVALLLISEPVIATLFERGSFTADATASTAAALFAFTFGLPAFAIARILRTGFFAREDTGTPMRVALACIAINLVLNLLLMEPMGHVGIALATSAASWFNVAVLLYILVRRKHFTADRRLRRRMMRTLAACLGMAGILAGLQPMLGFEQGAGEWARVVSLGTLLAVGFVSFAGLAFLFGAVRARDFAAFRR